jgi:hypothetical protein
MMLIEELPDKPLGTRIRVGATWGIGLGLGCIAWVTFLALLPGSARFERLGIPYLVLVAFYLLSGAVAGGIVGLLMPWSRRLPLRMVIGFLAALPISLALSLVVPVPTGWGAREVVHVVLIWAGIVGPLGALVFSAED